MKKLSSNKRFVHYAEKKGLEYNPKLTQSRWQFKDLP